MKSPFRHLWGNADTKKAGPDDASWRDAAGVRPWFDFNPSVKTE
jgi:hypothetical protein